MKVHPSQERPCRMKRGEVRRVPQARSAPLIGYHLCCPRCGFVTPALQHDEGVIITEGDDPVDITFSRPVRCMYCQVLIGLRSGEFDLVEDQHVRVVRYR